MRENEPVLLVLSVCDGKIILEKGEILYEKCQLRQKVLEMRPFCLSTIEIHEVLWLKMRMELRQTT